MQCNGQKSTWCDEHFHRVSNLKTYYSFLLRSAGISTDFFLPPDAHPRKSSESSLHHTKVQQKIFLPFIILSQYVCQVPKCNDQIFGNKDTK